MNTTKERLEKFVAELRDLERKYNVMLIADSGDELVEIEVFDSELGNESIPLN